MESIPVPGKLSPNELEFLETFVLRYLSYGPDGRRWVEESLDKFHQGVLEHGNIVFKDHSVEGVFRMAKDELKDLGFYIPLILLLMRELRNDVESFKRLSRE